MKQDIETKYIGVDREAVREKLVSHMGICIQPERLIQWFLYDAIDSDTKRLSGNVELKIEAGQVVLKYVPLKPGVADIKLGAAGPKPVIPDQAANPVPDPVVAPELPIRALSTEHAYTSSLITTEAPVSLYDAELVVSSFEKANAFMQAIGMHARTFQEKKREIWEVGGVKVYIDTWPWLDTLIIIDDKNHEELAVKLGLDPQSKTEASIEQIYVEKYNIDPSMFMNLPELKFMRRPSWM